MGIAFVHSVLSKAFSDWTKLPFEDVELALTLLHSMVEAKANLPGDYNPIWFRFISLRDVIFWHACRSFDLDQVQKGMESFFAQAIQAVITSSILPLNSYYTQSVHYKGENGGYCFFLGGGGNKSSWTRNVLIFDVYKDVVKHSHRAVVVEAFSTITSYARYLPNDPSLMTSILDAYLTSCVIELCFFSAAQAHWSLSTTKHSGLRHHDKIVRNTTSRLFLEFIRAKRTELKPYTRHLLGGLKVRNHSCINHSLIISFWPFNDNRNFWQYRRRAQHWCHLNINFICSMP